MYLSKTSVHAHIMPEYYNIPKYLNADLMFHLTGLSELSGVITASYLTFYMFYNLKQIREVSYVSQIPSKILF